MIQGVEFSKTNGDTVATLLYTRSKYNKYNNSESINMFFSKQNINDIRFIKCKAIQTIPDYEEEEVKERTKRMKTDEEEKKKQRNANYEDLAKQLGFFSGGSRKITKKTSKKTKKTTKNKSNKTKKNKK
jgi:hypothetical protein